MNDKFRVSLKTIPEGVDIIVYKGHKGISYVCKESEKDEYIEKGKRALNEYYKNNNK
jgi:dihydrodipicolinate synthase/N-acetylneuraminate lyase